LSSDFKTENSMGHSQTEKRKNHERIVRTASKRFREKGLEGVGIADLMKEVGLTVGGFYKHFDSRDDLVVEALRSALGTWRRQAEAAASGGPPPLTYTKLVDDYLSEAHRDHPGTGCPIGALAGEIARRGKRTRALFTEEIRNAFGLIADLTPGKDQGPARSRAILTLSALVGAIGLSRAISDEALSREILKTVGELLKKEARE
jgi:TetR/AcrR family transcriptional regulator, transcriptional repressor for nem operon